MSTLNNGIIYTNGTCIGCNRCVNACPIPGANIAVLENKENKVYVDSSKCIACCKCLDACSHESRCFHDDTDSFFEALKRGESISIIFAPAFTTNYPSQYKHILAYLKSIGVKEFYNVSFGADITTWAYINYIQEKKQKGLIAQPCPAVVNYIEHYTPELLDKLIPIQSPMMCTAVFLKKYLKKTEKLAFISPCVAKKMEVENFPGYIHYNVTFAHLMKKLESVNLSNYKPIDDEIEYGMGAVFPMPGGLKNNVSYYLGYDLFVTQVEGEEHAYEYMDAYSKRPEPNRKTADLIDVLNCQRGCNYGTGTLCKHTLTDDIAFELNNTLQVNYNLKDENMRLIPQQDRLRLLNERFSDLKRSDFTRTYRNKYKKELLPNEKELDKVFHAMLKASESDRHIDCGCCGYRSCGEMASAISCGYNYVSNCIHYLKTSLEVEKERQSDYINEMTMDFNKIHASIEELYKYNSDSLTATKEITSNINSVNDNSDVIYNALSEIQNSVRLLGEASQEIISISRQTNILSINSSIEAARAGSFGKSFSVVASEIRKLSQKIRTTADKNVSNTENTIHTIGSISNRINNLKSCADKTHDSSEGIEQTIGKTMFQINEILDITNKLLSKYSNSDIY